MAQSRGALAPAFLVLMFVYPLSASGSFADIPVVARSSENAPNASAIGEIIVDVGEWRVGDQWIWDVTLDAVSLVSESGLDGAELNLMTGTATTVLDEIRIDGQSPNLVPVARRHTIGTFSGVGVFPVPVVGTISGVLVADLDAYETFRISDGAKISMSQNITLVFDWAVGSLTLASIDMETHWYPPLEFHDPPLRHNETWHTESNRIRTWSGESDFIPIPDDENEIIPLDHTDEVANLSSNVAGLCPLAGNSSATDSSGTIIEWRAWCPSVRSSVEWWSDDAALSGVDGHFVLKEFNPASDPWNGKLISISSDPSAPIERLSGWNITLDVPERVDVVLWWAGSSESVTLAASQPYTKWIEDTGDPDSSGDADEWFSDGVVVCIGPSDMPYSCIVSSLEVEGLALEPKALATIMATGRLLIGEAALSNRILIDGARI